MSLLDILETRRRRKSAAADALPVVRREIKAARRAMHASLAGANKKQNRLLALIVAALVAVALALAGIGLLLSRTVPAESFGIIVSVSPPPAAPGTTVSERYETETGWAFRTRRFDEFANCDETRFSAPDAMVWSRDGEASRTRTLADLIRDERASLLAVVIDVGHDARELTPDVQLPDNAALVKRRAALLSDAVRLALGSGSPQIPVVAVTRGSRGRGLTAHCHDRRPGVTLISRTKGSTR